MNVNLYEIVSPTRGLYLGLDDRISPHFSVVKRSGEGLLFTDISFANKRKNDLQKVVRDVEVISV